MNKVNITFANGPKVEIVGEDNNKQYHIEFINADTQECVYRTEIKVGNWSAPNPKYYIRWQIDVYEGGVQIINTILDLKNQSVLIALDSKSLGDTIAWIPYVEEFRKKHECKVYVMTFWNSLFESVYPDLQFINYTDTGIASYFAVYRIGCFDGDVNKNKNNWRLIPLQQIASDVLGLPFQEIKPRIVGKIKSESDNIVCISEYSTFHAKQWNTPGAWQSLVDWLSSQGFVVWSISKEPTSLKGVIRQNNRTIEETIENISRCKFFIGVSSGPAMIAWTLGKPVFCISGFTGATEPSDWIKIQNSLFCNSCFQDQTLPLDRNNWFYCPRKNDHICSRSVTTEMVVAKINNTLHGTTKKDGLRILFITPHCSTGGGPQYLLKCVEELVAVGNHVEVVEYANISDAYTVQKNKIKAIVLFHTLGENKSNGITSLLKQITPDVVHVQELPEAFMDEASMQVLYQEDRKYKIVETSHGKCTATKIHMPDKFAFVSMYHKKTISNEGVVVEYVPERVNQEKITARSKLNINPNRKQVLCVGLFAPWKNQAEAFEVARRLPGVDFNFVGNTAENFESYWHPLLNNKPSNCVIWKERDDVDLFYQACDLLLFPSTNELFPIVLKEALAYGLLVVMRNLEVYCGAYSENKNVTFMQDVDSAVAAITKQLFPMSVELLKAYV